MNPPFVVGLVTGLSLIVAIGAQNAFVLRQAVLRRPVLVVVAICTVSDIVLIALGTVGVGEAVQRYDWLLRAMRYAGAAYLMWFSFTAFRSALRPQALTVDTGPSRGRAAVTALALTFLNPHVYLDTVVMLGSLGNQFGSGRWEFAGGAALASTLWFPLLGLAGRSLARPLARPGTWRVVDILIGLTMAGLAVYLVLG